MYIKLFLNSFSITPLTTADFVTLIKAKYGGASYQRLGEIPENLVWCHQQCCGAGPFSVVSSSGVKFTFRIVVKNFYTAHNKNVGNFVPARLVK